MSEIRTLNPVDDYIYPSATITAALRALPRELQNFLGWLFFHEADAGSGVVGGFAVTEAAARRSDVSRGAALAYDSAAASPLSKWAWVYSETTLTATHDPHGAEIRYDLLTLTWASDTDTAETLGRVGGVPASVDTQRGGVVTLHITKGATTGSAIPSTPAGHLLLYLVQVPATSGALVYIDKRTYLPGPATRSGQQITWKEEAADGVFSPLVLAAQKMATSETAWTSYMFRWSKTLDRPYCSPGRAGAGDHRYFMLAKDRRWWESTAVVDGAVVYTGGGGGAADLVVETYYATASLRIVSNSAGAEVVQVFVPLRVQARSLKIVDAKIDYALGSAFNGSTMAVTAGIYNDDGAIATLDIDAAGVVARANADFDTVTPTLVAESDRVWLAIVVQRTGTGITDVGSLSVYGVSLRFEEGND